MPGVWEMVRSGIRPCVRPLPLLAPSLSVIHQSRLWTGWISAPGH